MKKALYVQLFESSVFSTVLLGPLIACAMLTDTQITPRLLLLVLAVLWEGAAIAALWAYWKYWWHERK